MGELEKHTEAQRPEMALRNMLELMFMVLWYWVQPPLKTPNKKIKQIRWLLGTEAGGS